MAAAGGAGGPAGASGAAGRSRRGQRLRGGLGAARPGRPRGPGSRVRPRREHGEEGARRRPLPPDHTAETRPLAAPASGLRPRGANLRMGRDRGFRSSLLLLLVLLLLPPPTTRAAPPRPSRRPRPRRRRSGSNPAAACGKRLRAGLSLPIGGGKVDPASDWLSGPFVKGRPRPGLAPTSPRPGPPRRRPAGAERATPAARPGQGSGCCPEAVGAVEAHLRRGVCREARAAGVNRRPADLNAFVTRLQKEEEENVRNPRRSTSAPKLQGMSREEALEP